MPDPAMDLEKLKAVKEWSEDLADELTLRSDLLPCKNVERGDCIKKQSHLLIEEMKPSKMCLRCQIKWFAMRTAKGIGYLYSIKTERESTTTPNYGE